MVPATDDERMWFLQSVPALRGTDPAALRSVLPHLDEGHVPAGHVLAGGESSSAVVVLIDGLVEACTPAGRRRAVLGPGTVVGHLPGCDAPASGEVVRTITAVVAGFLPAARFTALWAGSEGVAAELSGEGRTRGG